MVKNKQENASENAFLKMETPWEILLFFRLAVVSPRHGTEETNVRGFDASEICWNNCSHCCYFNACVVLPSLGFFSQTFGERQGWF